MTPDPAEAAPDLLAHAEGVRRLARSLVRDFDRAEDVAQEALLRGVEKPPHAGWSPRAWLSGVVRHVAASMARGDRRRIERERRAARPEAVPSVADAVARVAEQRRVLEAVLSLDADSRVVVVLRFFEGMPPREIARRLDLPVETVRTRIKRALARLRDRLQAAHGDRRSARGTLLWLASGKPATWILLPGLGAIAMKKAMLVTLLLVALGLGAGTVLLGSLGGGDPADRPAAPAPARTAGERPGLAPAAPPPAEGTAGVEVGADVDLGAADRDLDLHGVVLREDGSPVPGALVRTLSYPTRRVFTLDYDSFFRAREGPSTRTSRTGTFRLRLERGERVHVVASASGLATIEVPDCLAGERVRLVLRPEVRLLVTVRDAHRAPVPHTALRLWRSPKEPDVSFERHAKADAAGTATFGDLPGPTQALLEAIPETLGTPAWTRVALPASGEVSVEVEVPPGRTIAGQVTDADTRRPIPGARVGVGWVLARDVRTDSDGRYTLRGWTAEASATVHVLADGYARASRRVDVSDVMDFALAKGDSVVGRLVSPSGQPVGAARVSAVAYGTAELEERICSRAGESGSDGRFRLDGLIHDLPHSLIVIAGGRGRTLLDFDPPATAGGTTDVGDVALADGRRIEGRVVSADDSPKARIPVTLRGANADRTRLRPGQPALDFSYGLRESCFTDDLGRFRFRDLAPGSYALTALSPGEAALEATVEIGETDVLGVEMRGASGRTLEVTVVDSVGGAVPGAAVSLTDVVDGAWRGQARTGPDGVAAFVIPRSATVRAIVSPPPVAGGKAFLPATPVRIEAFATEASVTLEDAAVVSGRVLDEAGRPLSGAEVRAQRSGKILAIAFANAEGRFEMSVPGGASLDIVLGTNAAGSGRTFVPSPYAGSLVGVRAGSTDLVLRAARAPADRRLRVVVLDPEGRPAVGVTVTPPPEWMGRVAAGPETDAAGVVEWLDLIARPASFSVWPGPASAGAGRWLWESVGPVVPDGQTVTVRLREGVRVSGIVLRPDGTPVRRANVLARRGEETVGGAQSGEDGRFSILLDPTRHLPFDLRASDPEDARSEATLPDLRAGAEDVTLRLARKE